MVRKTALEEINATASGVLCRAAYRDGQRAGSESAAAAAETAVVFYTGQGCSVVAVNRRGKPAVASAALRAAGVGRTLVYQLLAES